MVGWHWSHRQAPHPPPRGLPQKAIFRSRCFHNSHFCRVDVIGENQVNSQWLSDVYRLMKRPNIPFFGGPNSQLQIPWWRNPVQLPAFRRPAMPSEIPSWRCGGEDEQNYCKQQKCAWQQWLGENTVYCVLFCIIVYYSMHIHCFYIRFSQLWGFGTTSHEECGPSLRSCYKNMRELGHVFMGGLGRKAS